MAGDVQEFTDANWEAAVEGAYAFRKLGRADDAAALYRSFVRKWREATVGESESAAKAADAKLAEK